MTTPDLTPAELRKLRLRSQALTAAASETDIASLFDQICSLQAQELPAARLGIWARTQNQTFEDIDKGLFEERSILRTWSMRGTLHITASADASWLIPLLGQLFIDKSKRRYKELGLDDQSLDRAHRILQKSLSDHGDQTRAQLAEHLERGGVRAEGQAAYHILRHAGLSGLVCYGPEANGEPTFTLLESWLREPFKPERGEFALAKLARRYLQAFGPAEPADFATWSGLALGDARAAFAGLANETVEVMHDGACLSMLERVWDTSGIDSDGSSSILLLPAYDSYLLGYKNRNLILDSEYARKVHPGGGVLRPTLVIDGKVSGTWQLKHLQNRVRVQVNPFDAFPMAILHLLVDEVEALGRFFSVEAELALNDPIDSE